MNDPEIKGHQPDEEEIFFCASQISDLRERDAYLSNACMGLDQQRRIEGLIRAASTLGDFMHAPAITVSDDQLPQADRVELGQQIGRYRIERRLGGGGCGEVFQATQTEPVERGVALKFLHSHLFGSNESTNPVVRRFQDEQQTLARLEHPGIVRLIDASVTDKGRPYLVMEWVDGKPLDEFLRECDLSVDDRLRLFADICAAVGHAHQKGIVHRDLKPSNVLVTQRDQQFHARLIDFGIARLVRDPTMQMAESMGGHTIQGELIGTPHFMAPEQIRHDLDIDTRTDIYALGGLLFSMFAGRSPVENPNGSGNLADVFDAIREDDPPRLSLMDLALPPPPEVDWIIATAMRKNPNERYATVAAFSDDIARLHAGLPVSVGAPTWTYSTRKWIARNRIVASAIGFVLAAILIGTLIGASGLRRAQAALARETAAKETAVSQRDRADQMRQQAERISEMLAGLADASNTRHARPHDFTARELLAEFSDSLDDKLSDQPRVEARLRHILGRSFLSYGDLQNAKTNFLRAKEILDRDDIANTDTDYDDTENEKAKTELQLELGGLHLATSDWKQAREFLERANQSGRLSPQSEIRSLERLAELDRLDGKTETASDRIDSALGITKRLNPADPSLHAHLLATRALIHLDQYDAESADATSQEAMQLIENHDVNQADVAFVKLARAEALAAMGDPKAASIPMREAEAMQQKVIGPSETLVRTLVLKSRLLRENRRIRQASVAAADAVRMADGLEVNRGAASLVAYRNRAVIVSGYDDDQSVDQWHKACQLSRDLQGPGLPLLRDLYDAGMQALRCGRLEDAMQWFEEAISIPNSIEEGSRVRTKLFVNAGVCAAQFGQNERADQLREQLWKMSRSSAKLVEAEMHMAEQNFDAARLITNHLEMNDRRGEIRGLERGQWQWLMLRLEVASGEKDAAMRRLEDLRRETRNRRGAMQTYLNRAETLVANSLENS